ncbi:MAG: IPT/TIG domain-containing protein [Cyanobacteria bacterium SZAS LIN-3]|nr:IPT/TIG domain-containing protein [Cyanobacteria bacterium SZAS LIN-3]
MTAGRPLLRLQALIASLLPLGLALTNLFQPAPALAADYNRDIVYQIFTDRFFSGRSDNDDPSQSSGLFDGSHKNWRAYWGGDLAGIKAKLDYIKGLGVTAIWISPVIDNINKADNDVTGKMVAPYHGYHARDFMRVEEHFGDPANTFADFDALIEAAHRAGLKVFVDMPFNHTSPYNHGEYGALFSSGQYRSDVENDKNKYFNHLPAVTDFNNRFQLQYHTIFYLGDLNQENSYIDTYLKIAAQKLRDHGADGTRLDAAKHTNWAWQETLSSLLYEKGDHLILGEWWMSGLDDPLYRDAVKFANRGGVSLFDFPLAMAIREAFKGKAGGDLQAVARVVSREDIDFNDSRSLLTFIDNHDLARFQSINPDPKDLHLALALLFTSRGIPIVYYGTEQYLHDDTAGGEDPYDRPWMNSFDAGSPGYTLIKSLSALRSGCPPLVLGRQETLHAAADDYVFARRAGSDCAVVALNKSRDKTLRLEGLQTGLADGVYPGKFALGGGQSELVVRDGLGRLEVAPQSLIVWAGDNCAKGKDGAAVPVIGAVRPPKVAGGTSVTVYGRGFGETQGKLTVGDETLSVSSWHDDKIVFNAPRKSLGAVRVDIATAGGVDSVPVKLFVSEGRLINVRFTCEDAPLQEGEQIFLTGNASSLGMGRTTWMDAAGPMIYSDDERKYILCVPMPAGKTVDVKMVILDRAGSVVKQESAAHKYQVPAEGSWQNNLNWQK